MRLRYTRYTNTYSLRRSVRRSTKAVLTFPGKESQKMNSDNSQVTRQTFSGRGSQTREGNKSAKWDDYRIRLFCRLCITEVNNGHIFGNKLTELGFENVQRGFLAETGELVKPRALVTEWTKLRKIHAAWMRLKNSTGISFSHDGTTIIADPEWWDDKIAACAEVKYLVGGYPHLTDMNVMFSRTRDMARFGWSPRAPRAPIIPNISAFVSSSASAAHVTATEHEEQQQNEAPDGLNPPDLVRNQFMPSRVSTSTHSPAANMVSGSSGSGRGKRKREQQNEELYRLENMINEVNGGIGKLTESINPTDIEVESVMEVVATLPNVNWGDPFWTKAGDYFMESKERRRFFIRVLKTPEERFAFLSRVLYH